MSLEIIQADFDNPEHAEHIVYLTDQYARDPMGGGTPLTDEAKARMVEGLKNMPNALVLLAYLDGEAVGIANCFIGFATFPARRLIYVHDLAVIPTKRGQNIGLNLLNAVQETGKELGCYAISLEVLENNPAKRLYERFGFDFEKPNYLFAKKVID
ncbi:MAG: GNAT family N-acetyltransferase [Balneolaceae bacterium]|nr:GNAT family N-acetyltransferase [Balneolaceae bacterium]